ncbi:hypothetical protein F5Y16DRAFT_399017 [Xylariaceae sp. FL0255]|nr:hypothetical protein F5Y16DRAFT_399017 [Xylariaceae sp. FL0255]
MSSFSAQRRPELPSSPWAERFPFTEVTYIKSEKNHSSLAPVYPRIDDPTYYDQKGGPPLSPTDNDEIDKLFRHEQSQIKELLGIRTWEAAVLSRLLLFASATGVVSGGHQLSDEGAAKEAVLTSYARDKIQVDETKWLPFFQKGRWFDWIDSDPFDLSQGQQRGAKTWSADDPTIWNSLLTVLWGRIEDWDAVQAQFGSSQLPGPTEDRRVLIDYATEQRIAQAQGKEKTRWDAAATRTVQESRDRLVKLLDGLLWGFSPTIRVANASAVTQYIPINRSPAYMTFIHLSTETVEKLANPDLVLAELCQIQVAFAVDIVHELMHALMDGRNDPSDRYEGNRWNKALQPPMLEPYLNAEGVIEIGAIIETRIFGGMLRNRPTLRNPDWIRAQVQLPIPIVATVMNYPRVGCTNEQTATLNSTWLLAKQMNTVDHVPLLWHSMMLSEEFWGREDPKSTNYFHRARLFIAQSPNQANGVGPSTWRPPTVQDVSSQGAETVFDASVVTAWKEKQAEWASARAGWYDESRKLWIRSPWMHLSMRDLSRGFADAFARRDEVQCASIAIQLYSVVAINTPGTANYRNYLPKPDGQAIRTRWPWHVLGLLMMASMPIRAEDVTGQEIKKESRPNKHTPSRQAALAGLSTPVTKKLPPESDRNEVGSSFLYCDTGGLQLQLLQGSIVKQQDYLDQANKILLEARDTAAIVHKDFFWALVRAHQEIEDSRQNIANEYPDGADKYRWLPDWVFQMPAYDPTIMSYDLNQKQWGAFPPGS